MIPEITQATHFGPGGNAEDEEELWLCEVTTTRTYRDRDRYLREESTTELVSESTQARLYHQLAIKRIYGEVPEDDRGAKTVLVFGPILQVKTAHRFSIDQLESIYAWRDHAHKRERRAMEAAEAARLHSLAQAQRTKAQERQLLAELTGKYGPQAGAEVA